MGNINQLEFKFALVYKVDLPSIDTQELTPVSVGHVTLIGGKTAKPFKTQIATLLQNINNYPELQNVPEPQFGSPSQVSRPDGRITLAVPITNQSEFTQYVNTLCKIAGINNPDPNRFFHISVANNQGGDPFKSIGDINVNDFSAKETTDQPQTTSTFSKLPTVGFISNYIGKLS